MALKCGIVGLPNVGKTTLYNCLSDSKAQVVNLPFYTKKSNTGIITVPDKRLAKLAEIDKPQRIVPAIVDIVDIAGLVKGSSKGEGLGNQFLAGIRETDAIIHILRCFDNDQVIHVDGSVDPVRDKEITDAELQMKDLETLEGRLSKLEKQAKHGGDQRSKRMFEIAREYRAALGQGKPARSLVLSEEDARLAREFFLLTNKPVLYVCNVDETSAKNGNRHVDAVKKAIEDEDAGLLVIDAASEAEIARMENEEEKQMFLEYLGLDKPATHKIIRAAYNLLDLHTFFTTGKDESRAWTFKKGMKAPQTAGLIHSDIERGFIRAEVINYHDYVSLGSEAACREAGKMSVEGKGYEVQDGDIINFRFNV